MRVRDDIGASRVRGNTMPCDMTCFTLAEDFDSWAFANRNIRLKHVNPAET